MASNAFGFTGSFAVLEDSAGAQDYLVHSDLDPDTSGSSAEPSVFDAQTLQACVSGTIAQVTTVEGYECYPPYYYYPSYCAWTSLWGGGISMDMTPDVAVDFESMQIVGIHFSYSGDFEGQALMLNAIDSSGVEYCHYMSPGVAPGSYAVPFTDFMVDCTGAGGPTLNPADVMTFEWLIPPVVESPIQVSNFCIEDVAFYDASAF
jgi:hypothetical protein